MRQSLINFFKNTVVLKYTLPNQQLGIDKSIYTTIDNDYCYQVDNDDKLVELIVNSIVDYSFNDRELVNKDIIKSISPLLGAGCDMKMMTTLIQKKNMVFMVKFY